MSNSKINNDIESRKTDPNWSAAHWLGFTSAVLTVVLAAVFIALGIFGTSYTASNPYPYISPIIKNIDYAIFYPAFLLAPVFVVLMTCIHYYASDNKKIFSQIGLSFAIIYAAIITTDYFIQWTVVLPSIINGQTGNLSLISIYNPHGIFVALESLGYLIMNIAFLFTATVFNGGRLERAIKWIFVISFILAMGSFLFTSLMKYDIVIFEVIIISIICTVLIISGTLLSILFRRTMRIGR